MVSVNTVGGDQLQTGSKRAVPGWFHVNVLHIAENEKCTGIELQLSVLNGKPNDHTVTDFIDSTASTTLWYPDHARPQEEQDRNNARLTALLIALDLITPDQLGQPVNVDEKLGVGRHCLVHLKYKAKKALDSNGKEVVDPKTGKPVWEDDTRYLEIAWSDILHIDDPAGKHVPQNVGAHKFIPAQHRHPDPKYFAFKAKPGTAASTASGGTTVASSQTQQKQTVTAGASDEGF